ncbi:MAG: SRPBCC domain-containing protein [Stigonema ocellatum SAG 48.90 = DSM 106950]|nr:SRPBCC domain-containing protein [Stigonema ocellatum SAG 48.90 = DSM 106950]
MEIYTEIEINSASDKVWEILTNLHDYLNWNPFLIKADGEIKEGSKINIVAQPPGLKSMAFSPTIIKAEQNRELRWKGKFILPGIFDGDHIFMIEELGGKGVRFIQKEFYSGLLIPLLGTKLENSTRKGFEFMNQAIKKRAESPNLYVAKSQ